MYGRARKASEWPSERKQRFWTEIHDNHPITTHTKQFPQDCFLFFSLSRINYLLDERNGTRVHRGYMTGLLFFSSCFLHLALVMRWQT